MLEKLPNFFNYSLVELSEYLTLDTLVFVFVGLLLIFISKWFCDIFQPSFKLDHELLEEDNKALAVSFLGYILGIGIILVSVMGSPQSSYFSNLNIPLLPDIIDLTLWVVIGTILLNISRLVNDKFILKNFSNKKEIIEDRNVGTGIVQFGSYIASALIIAPIIASEGEGSFIYDLLLTIFYFVLAQIMLIIFSWLYERVINYDLHGEIEKDNEAVGIAFGLNLVAIGIIISFPIRVDGGFLLFLFWFVNGWVILSLARVFLDKLIFHKSNLKEELVRDKNWGIALLEGGISIIIAYIINATFI